MDILEPEFCNPSRFPLINDVRICVDHPLSLLSVWNERLTKSRAWLQEEERSFDVKRSLLDRYSRERAEKLLEGHYLTQDLIDACFKPIREYLEKHPYRPCLVDFVYQLAPGWSIKEILPYFYQDWGNVDNYLNVRDMVLNALSKVSDRKGDIVVLGCGAGGLLYHVAPLFNTAYGLDLSVPTLFITQYILRGGKANFAFEDTHGSGEYTRYSVGPVRPRDNIALIVSDVHELPLTSGKLSAVITQYLLDIIADPENTLQEIWRVLKSDGVWISYGLPFRMFGDPLLAGNRDHRNVEACIQQFGFYPIEISRDYFSFLDGTKLMKWAHQNIQTPVFIVAKKNTTKCYIDSEKVIKHRNRIDWNSKPRLTGRRIIKILRGTRFTNQPEDAVEIQVEGVVEGIPISESLACLLENSFKKMNGNYTFREIADFICKDNRIQETEMLFKALHRNHIITCVS